MTIRLHPLLCLSVLVFALPLPAQRTLTTVFGAAWTTSLGRDVAAIDDVDGDSQPSPASDRCRQRSHRLPSARR